MNEGLLEKIRKKYLELEKTLNEEEEARVFWDYYLAGFMAGQDNYKQMIAEEISGEIAERIAAWLLSTFQRN